MSLCDVEQTVTVDVHEVAPDVHLQHPAGQLPVVALAAEVLLQAVDAVVRAAPLDAGVAVADKGALQRLVRVVEVEMMHDAVSKQRSEDLSLLGVVDDESTWTVGPYRYVTSDHLPDRPCSA